MLLYNFNEAMETYDKFIKGEKCVKLEYREYLIE